MTKFPYRGHELGKEPQRPYATPKNYNNHFRPTGKQRILQVHGAAATWPLAARAQTNRVRKIGVLLVGSENDAEMRAEVFALQKGLQELGWTEGRNVHFEFRWPNGDPDRTRAYAMEFVGLAPM
jgi:putative ABC transport system substrate-binding protein